MGTPATRRRPAASLSCGLCPSDESRRLFAVDRSVAADPTHPIGRAGRAWHDVEVLAEEYNPTIEVAHDCPRSATCVRVSVSGTMACRTSSEYKSLLDAEDGYRSRRWWKAFKREAVPGQQRRLYPSYPADHVSWHDATAFCRWLSHGLGWQLLLPRCTTPDASPPVRLVLG